MFKAVNVFCSVLEIFTGDLQLQCKESGSMNVETHIHTHVPGWLFRAGSGCIVFKHNFSWF